MKLDQQIISAIAKGDRKAFKLLYDRYHVMVYNTALNFTKNVEDAEEVLQDVFVKVHFNASKFRQDSTLSTWIYRITINQSLTTIKTKKRKINTNPIHSNMEEVDFVHPGVILENKENAITLYKVMDELPTSQKSAFILSYIEGLPRKEVAEIMEVTLKSVESLLQRAKSNLRKNLENTYPNRRK